MVNQMLKIWPGSQTVVNRFCAVTFSCIICYMKCYVTCYPYRENAVMIKKRDSFHCLL